MDDHFLQADLTSDERDFGPHTKTPTSFGLPGRYFCGVCDRRLKIRSHCGRPKYVVEERFVIGSSWCDRSVAKASSGWSEIWDVVEDGRGYCVGACMYKL